MLYWTESTQMSSRLRSRDSGCNYIFPYNVMSEYSNDFASMSFVRTCPVGTYVAIAMRITEVTPRWTWPYHDPFLQVMGIDTEGAAVGPLRLWQREEGDIKVRGAYVVRGLKVVNGRLWDDTMGKWIRSVVGPLTIECNVRTACEDVEDLPSIMQFL